MTMNPINAVNAHLMQALNFTPDDLAANRKGQLTETQQNQLKSLAAQGQRTVLVIAAMVILIVVGVCVYLVLGSQGIVPVPEALSGASDNAVLVVAVMGVVMVFYVLMLIVSLSRTRRMGSGKMGVKALTGKVKIKTQGMARTSAASVVAEAAGAATVSYILQVGREKIYTANPRVSGAFQDGVTYRVYVVGRKPGYILVSAEAVSAG